ncbi:hypothetical protein MMPV_001740 [Pyropia vietnamensis]
MDMAPADDDPVVETHAVYLSLPPPGSRSVLLQHVLRAAAVPVGSDRPVVALRFRPTSTTYEMDLRRLPSPVTSSSRAVGGGDTSGRSFDPDRLASLGGGVQTLSSSLPPTTRANHMAAVFLPPPPAGDGTAARGEARGDSAAAAAGGGRLVLTPLHTVAQMRPSFAYVDERIEGERSRVLSARTEKRGGGMGDIKAEPGAPAAPDGGGDDADLVAVGVSFKKRETARAAERRAASHTTLMAVVDAEAWRDAAYFPSTAPASAARRRALFDPQGGGGEGAAAATAEAVPSVALEEPAVWAGRFRLTDAGPPATGAAGTTTGGTAAAAAAAAAAASASAAAAAAVSPGGPPLARRELLRLPLGAAIRHVVARARLVEHGALSRTVLGASPSAAAAAALADAAGDAALHLRGCWVARARTAGPGGAPLSSTAAAARAVVLGAFLHSRTVAAADVTASVTAAADGLVVVDAAAIEEWLAEVADRVRRVGWVFKVPDGTAFAEGHPRLAAAHRAAWEKRVASARGVLKKKAAAARAAAGGAF